MVMMMMAGLETGVYIHICGTVKHLDSGLVALRNPFLPNLSFSLMNGKHKKKLD
jgi:hypothetical protein